MKGFEININSNKTIIGVNSGVTIISVSSQSEINLRGMDDETGLHVQWNQLPISFGDRVTITAKDIKDESAAPADMTILDRKKLLNDYLELKSFLIERGLLK